MRRIHGLAVTSPLAGLLALVLVALVLVAMVRPASAAPIPARYLTLYRQAARTCPGLTWEVLAGIGTVESANGQSRARGVHRGKNHKGAEGPMQFEPATFAEYAVRADRTAKLTPYDPADAVFTAARMLCADGAANGPQGLRRAIYAYNHACWYVRDVLTLAAWYAGVRKPRPVRTGFCAVHHRKHGHGKHGDTTSTGTGTASTDMASTGTGTGGSRIGYGRRRGIPGPRRQTRPACLPPGREATLPPPGATSRRAGKPHSRRAGKPHSRRAGKPHSRRARKARRGGHGSADRKGRTGGRPGKPGRRGRAGCRRR